MKSLWAHVKPLGLLAVITILYRWKILLTNQFTLLSYDEAVNQGYCWLTYCVRCLQHGKLPIWDPYNMAGQSFVGEMQTSAFSPFNFLVALFPLKANGLLSVAVFNWYIATLLFLAMAMMYWLARDLKLERTPAVIAAVCFGMGGTLIHNVSWPHIVQSGIWLPLVFLTCRRALEAESWRRTLSYAWGCGLAMGMAVLAGGLHMVIMQAMVVVTMAAYHVWRLRLKPEGESIRTGMVRAGLIVLVIAAVCFGAGAIQLLPSLEYSAHSIRFTGENFYSSNARIPYFEVTNHESLPRSLLVFVFPQGFDGTYSHGEFTAPYIGIFPMILVVLAFLKRWSTPWVQYCGLLAIGAWLYSFGELSLLHGLSYALIPKIWILRESSRLLYLTAFALALLAGYGAQVLLTPREGDGDSPQFDAVLKWVAIAAAGVLASAALFTLTGLHYYNEFSIVILLLAYWLYRLIQRRRSSVFGVVIVAFILFDLWPFDWSLENIHNQERGNKTFTFRDLVGSEGVVRFFRSQPGPFRVVMSDHERVNIGIAYSIFTVNGAGVTMDTDYLRIAGRQDLLNVVYDLKPASATRPGEEYSDKLWKVYRRPDPFGEGFVAHKVRELPLRNIEAELANMSVTFRDEALVEKDAPRVDPTPDASLESVIVKSYDVDRMELRVHAMSRGLLVLSEVYDPGWRAKVNGQSRKVLRVDGALRGVVVDRGDSTVVLVYRPPQILIGGILTVLTFLGGLAMYFVARRERRYSELVPD